jgi:hypothetical protein
VSTLTLVIVIAAVLLLIALALSRSRLRTNAGRIRRAHDGDGVAAPISDGALEGDELVLVRFRTISMKRSCSAPSKR